MPKKTRKIDNTHLSIDTVEQRGFLHRDYIAHCLRWTHVVRYLYREGRYKTARILDVGCGKEVPLAKLMHSSRLAPVEGYYLGVDYNQLELPDQFKNTKWKPDIRGGVAFPDKFSVENGDLVLPSGENVDLPNLLVSFEVIEHVEPKRCRAMLQMFQEILKEGTNDDSTMFLSTPCWDPKVGAADNHINELTYQALGATLEDVGFNIEGVYGTFASQRDYKDQMSNEVQHVYDRLSQYYDSNYLATVFAPLYPAHSRNCLWVLKTGTADYQRRFPALGDVPGPWTSSDDWKELAG